MPDNIEIASFVVGAILMLISILGGSFKIFGFESTSSVVDYRIRILSFLLGILLILFSLLPSIKKAKDGWENQKTEKKQAPQAVSEKSSDCVLLKKQITQASIKLKRIEGLLEIQPKDLKLQADKIFHQNTIQSLNANIQALKCD